jgi:hypothetical protein
MSSKGQTALAMNSRAPDGMSEDEVLQSFLEQLQSSAPQQDPAKAAADEEVAKERAESPGWENYISDVARNVVRGTPSAPTSTKRAVRLRG